MRVTQTVPDSFFARLHRHSPLFAGAMCVTLALSGCASLTGAGTTSTEVVAPDSGAQTTSTTSIQKFMWFFSPYRPTIQQGNFVSQEMLSQLKPGMTRDQVRFVLGTPLLTDIFHGDRWDYAFRLTKGNGEVTTSNVIVYFKDGVVARYDGGNLPTEKEYIARIAGTVPPEAPSQDMPMNPVPARSGAGAPRQ